MFLSNFSIKQPVTTVAIVIVLMCLGLLALKNLRVNQIPDVQQPVMVVNFPYPGASPETVEREIINRVEKSLQSIPQVYEIRSTASEGKRADRHHLQLQEGHVRGRGRDPQRHRRGALQAAARDARAGAVPRRSVAASPVMNLALSSTRSRTPRSRASPKTMLADRFRGIDGVSHGERQRLAAAASCRCCCTRRSCASTTSRPATWSTRCARRTPPRRWAGSRATLDEQSIRLVGRIESPREFNDIVVKRQGDEVVRLGQVATVRGRIRRAERLLACATAQPERRPVDHPLARRQHGDRGQARARRSRGDQQDAARRAPSSRSRTTAARTRRAASTT